MMLDVCHAHMHHITHLDIKLMRYTWNIEDGFGNKISHNLMTP